MTIKKKILGTIFFVAIFILVISVLKFYRSYTEKSMIPNSKNLVIGELPNGLKYYILKNAKPEKRATINMVVSVGSLNEDDDQRGLAHFLEHMAFNGTKNFPKNDLLKYLQSLGLNFGGDINAYTTFNKTVYTLDVPTTPKEIDAGFVTFKEWGTNISFTQKDIDDEKNIIISEWRLSQGLNDRAQKSFTDPLFADSKFLDRRPIGLPEFIKSATTQKFLNFYKRWYNPKNISLIIVGDFEVKDIENLIAKYFSYENNSEYQKPEKFDIKPTKENNVVFTDPEITDTSFQLATSGVTNPLN
ncbi:MAG: M16 family metallopeptidase, partial [Fusobacteriaceae bacterium]